MQKINFHYPENQFPLAGIRFFLKKLPPLYFENFNKALNKRILLPPDRKSVSTSRNKEFVKIYVSQVTVFTARNILQIEKIVFSLARKTVSTRTNEVFL